MLEVVKEEEGWSGVDRARICVRRKAVLRSIIVGFVWWADMVGDVVWYGG